MTDFIGVTRLDHILAHTADPLKREALLFNKIAITDLDVVFRYYEKFSDEWKLLCRDVEWLFEKGVIVNWRELMHDNKDAWSEVYELFKHAVYGFPTLPGEEEPATYHGKMKDITPSRALSTGADVMAISASLRYYCNADAVPIIDKWLSNSTRRQSSAEVIEVALQAMPIPDETTPWEQILEFRSDPDSYSKFLAFRNWMSDISQMKLEPREIKPKIEFLTNDFERHMRTHKMKTRLDTLKAIVIAESGFITGGWLAGLGFVPGIVGMVATPLYSIKQRAIKLLEEEQRAPGKELAYIVKAEKMFQSQR
jgi:hypothetical protein